MIYGLIFSILFVLWCSAVFIFSYFAQFGAGQIDLLTKAVFFLAFWPSKLLGLDFENLSKVIFNYKYYLINILGWILAFGLIWMVLLKLINFEQKHIIKVFKKMIFGLIKGNLVAILLFIVFGRIENLFSFIFAPSVLVSMFLKQKGMAIVGGLIYYITLSILSLTEYYKQHRKYVLYTILSFHVIIWIIILVM